MTELWPFQDSDISYLENQPSALIKWDMGLGKTFGALERDRRLRARHDHPDEPTLVCAPLQTHGQWADWIGRIYRHTPCIYSFSEDRELALKHLKHGDPGFYILHWELLRNVNPKYWAARELYPELLRTKFFHVIADECHRVKSRKAQQAKVLKKINHNSKSPTGFDGYRTGLTGTPITNRPPDLWSILNWLRPKEYSSYWAYDARYAIWVPVIRGSKQYREYVGPKNEEELRRKIRPFTVQRRKEDVLPDLPARYFTTIKVDLSAAQRRAYDSMRKNMVAWIGEHEDDPLIATAAVAKLMRLQQLAIAHASFDDEGNITLSEPSSKLDAVMEKLEDTEEQVVIFSQSKQAIKLLAARLSNQGISCSIFHGDVAQSQRRIELDRFKSGEARVFVATGQSGGEGLDGLQLASTLIRIDRSWSHARDDQEISRLDRAGQKSAVHVIDIVARDTVDQLKFRRIDQKRNWAAQVLDELGRM